MSKGGGAPRSGGGGSTKLVFGGIGAPRKNDKITPGKPYVPKGTNVIKLN